MENLFPFYGGPPLMIVAVSDCSSGWSSSCGGCTFDCGAVAVSNNSSGWSPRFELPLLWWLRSGVVVLGGPPLVVVVVPIVVLLRFWVAVPDDPPVSSCSSRWYPSCDDCDSDL